MTTQWLLQRWHRSTEWLAPRIRWLAGFFPLSLPGLLLLVLSGVVFWFAGIRRQDFVLLSAGALTAIVVIVMAVVVTSVAVPFHFGIRKAATSARHLECGVPQRTGFHALFPRRFPLVECTWRWENPARVDVRFDRRDPRVETIVPRRRGVHTAIHRRISVGDALGLASLRWVVREPADLRFLPGRGALDSLALLDGLGGGDDLSDPRGTPDGDRVDMRQYTQGDSPRMILWKVYARTRKLLVRVPERAVAAKPRACAYLVSGEGDEPGAGLMRVILERGFLGDGWRFGADGTGGFAVHLEDAMDRLVRSGTASASDPTGFPEFLKRAERDGYRTCALVLPPVPGPWVSAVLSAAAGTSMRVRACTVADGVMLRQEAPRLLDRLLYLQDRAGAPRLQDLERVGRDFAGCPFPFLLIDRQAGKVVCDVRTIGRGRSDRAPRPNARKFSGTKHSAR